MSQLKLYAPTRRRGGSRGTKTPVGLRRFDDPRVPVVVRGGDGIRIVLGSHDCPANNAPDVRIERRRGGWAIFLRPVGGSAPSGYVCFLDNGLSYLVPGDWDGPTPQIILLNSGDVVQQLDEPAPVAGDATLLPCEHCETDLTEAVVELSEDCLCCGARLRRLMEIRRLLLMQTRRPNEFRRRNSESRMRS
jgi:hypothetical protein